MVDEKIEKAKVDILNSLSDAGESGLNKGKLGKDAKIRNTALDALIKAGEVVNIGSVRRNLYVLKEFDNTLERAYDIIDRETSSKPKLFSEAAIKEMKALPAGKIREHAQAATDLLVKEGKLLKLKYIRILYLNVSSIKQPEPVTNKQVLTKDRVLEAYKKLREETKFEYVELYKLIKELSTTKEQLQEILLEESRLGNAVLNEGVWSDSSEEARAAAINLKGTPRLQVKYKG
ncbi:MAG: hypothetical protein SFH39_12360 [Candidatus Magnetobacterium sp. LHC-1]